MNKLTLILYVSIALLLTGCWDQVNIEDRGFVVGVSIDSDKSDDQSKTITVMNQFVIPQKTMAGQEEGEEKPYTNLVASGSSLTEIGQELSSLTARKPYYEHLKIVSFSDEIAKEPGLFESLADVFIRYQEMRRGTRIMIDSGESHNILEIKPDTGKIPAVYIDSLIDNSKNNIEFLEPVRMGELQAYLLGEDSFAIPHVTPLTTRIEANGASIFAGYNNQLIGNLNDEETKGLNLITRTNKSGSINFQVKDHLMVFSVNQTNSSIKTDVSDQENITITIHIDAKGYINEMYGSKSLLNESYMEEIEEDINKQFEHIIMNTVEKAQTELKVDFFGFSKILRRHHYAVWEQIKDDWDQGDHLFSKSKINVTVNSTIVSIGSSDKTKVKENE